jgi:UDP-GlcNAc:undecaprenyl-phosphate/decaprenyl-phosphate GlcNAc-1-phosphate transferase
MERGSLALAAVAFLLSMTFTWVVRKTAIRIGFVDKPGGRKVHDKPKALGGGVAITWSILLPLLLGAWLAPTLWPDPDSLMRAYLGGIRLQYGMAVAVGLACVAMHFLGLIDDKYALGPYSKLLGQILIVAGLLWAADIRLLTTLGAVPSAILTGLWILTITNALNFLDNMDGLSAGVAGIAASAMWASTLFSGQVFVGATLALVVGACLGFLVFNFAPASIFMGDSGSLVLGLLLGLLSVRVTYLPPDVDFSREWYAVLSPVLLLAVPLYDLLVVSALRLRQGRSPLRGDTNHFSHRLVRLGMSKRTAVLVIYLVTASTGVAATVLPLIQKPLAAMLIVLQVVLMLAIIRVLERGGDMVYPSPDSARRPPLPPRPTPQSTDSVASNG